MTKIIDLSGKGAAIDGTENDANLDSLSGINESIVATSHTIDVDDQNNTIEYSNASPIAVTLPAISTVSGANIHTSDFKVTLKNIGAGLVTVTRGGTDTFEDASTTLEIAQYDSVTLQTDSTLGKWNLLANDLDVATKTGAETFTNKTLTSPVINTGVSGTALETTLTNDDTKLPTSGAVFDKVAGLNTKVIDIGDWDMDATSQVTVAHGLTLSKIRSMTVMIRGDSGTTYYDLSSRSDYSLSSGNDGYNCDGTNAILNRATGGPFDNISYDSTGYNRGWITIQYTD
jgi:hypothetical protein